MSGETLALVIGMVSLSVTILGLCVAIAVFWNKMGDLLKIVSSDIKQVKKEVYGHTESGVIFQQKFTDWSERLNETLKYQKEVCAVHERKLEMVNQSLGNQQTMLGYMEKVFDEIKRLVDSNTQVARDIKTLLEQGYGRINKT